MFIAYNSYTPLGYIKDLYLSPNKRILATFSFHHLKLANAAIKLEGKQMSTNKLYTYQSKLIIMSAFHYCSRIRIYLFIYFKEDMMVLVEV